MTTIEDRLREAGVADTGHDWHDVAQRAARARRRRMAIRALGAASALALLAVPTIAFADRLSESLFVASGEERIAVPWISSRTATAYNVGGKERVELRRLLLDRIGDLEPAPPALVSPDGDHLLYESLTFERRVRIDLRLHALSSGAETVFAHDARSAAWRADGVVAYVKGPVSAPRPFIGHVLVRPSTEAEPEQWTEEPSAYTVLAWAGQSLLVRAAFTDKRLVRRRYGAHQSLTVSPGVYALDGPGRMRKLPVGRVIAVDPTGELLVGGPATSALRRDRIVQPTLRIVRVADGRALSEVKLPRLVTSDEAPFATGGYLGGGSWAGEYIVVSYLQSVENDTQERLAVLRYHNGELTLAQFFSLDLQTALDADLYGVAPQFKRPSFLDDEGREIVTWAQTPDSTVLLKCNRLEVRCSRSGALPGGPGGGFLIENPSRPSRD